MMRTEDPTSAIAVAVIYPASQEFWHSWRTFHPNTTRYEPSGTVSMTTVRLRLGVVNRRRCLDTFHSSHTEIMSVLAKLASALGRNDEAPNVALAEVHRRKKNERPGISELVQA
jgi:hypothetical protein